MTAATPTPKPTRTGTPTWLKMYHALGAFSVASVLAAVGLNTMLLDTYRDSVADSQIWAARSAGLGAISRSATQANGPGNDVFESGDIAGERAKLLEYTAEYRAQRDAAIKEVRDHVPPDRSVIMISQLETIDGHFSGLEGAAMKIFAALEANDKDTAGAEMARMDRELGAVSSKLGDLQIQIQGMQDEAFATQLSHADRLQWGSFGLVGLVGMMVVGVALYGKRLAAIFGAAEAEIQRRRDETALLLNNVDQGLVTVDVNGRMSTEKSAAFSRFFGEQVASGSFEEQLGTVAPAEVAWWDVGWGSLVEGFMPDAVLVTQLPQTFQNGDMHVALSYRVLREGGSESGAFQGLLVIATDVTATVEREKAEQAQRETMALFDRVSQDRLGVVEFMADADRIVRTLSAATEDEATEKRLLHTLKGNSGFYGLTSIMTVVHGLEDRITETDEPLTAEEREALTQAWDRVRTSAGRLLGNATEGRLEIGDQELNAILNAVLQRRPHAEIARRISELKLEPTRRRLDRLGEQANALAARLGRGDVDIRVEDNGARTDPTVTAAFWGSLVHVVRNALDHGFDAAEERAALGKPAALQLRLATTVEDEHLHVIIEEDGRGIDWEALRAKARAKNMLPLRAEDRAELLFMDGLSTRDEVTELSGRGVGMGAVRAELRALHGEVRVDSTQGRGTRFTFVLPLRASSGAAFEWATARTA